MGRSQQGEQSKSERPAISKPKSADGSWQKKAEAAQQARESGRAMRAGKPASFRSAVGRHA